MGIVPGGQRTKVSLHSSGKKTALVLGWGGRNRSGLRLGAIRPILSVSLCPALFLDDTESDEVHASVSYDPHGEDIIFNWDFGDGSLPYTTNKTTAKHTFTEPNQYEVTLRVSKEQLNGFYSVKLNISYVNPVLNTSLICFLGLHFFLFNLTGTSDRSPEIPIYQ